MSSIASLYVFTKDQLKELNKVAKTLPQQQKVPEGAQMAVVAVRPEDVDALTAPYEPFWDYIHNNGDDEAFDFNWSGEIMDRALLYLREKGIDLTKAKLVDTGDDELAFLIYDKKYKDKYLDKLEPESIDQDDLNNWLDEYVWGTPPEGVMDAIRNLHDFFQLIDDDHVVILHTDWIAGVIHSKPLKEQTSGITKQKMIVYLCNECGPRMEKNGGYKRISDVPTDKEYRCWTQIMITIKVVDGKEMEESKDVTMPIDEEMDDYRCKATATGCYRMVL